MIRIRFGSVLLVATLACGFAIIGGVSTCMAGWEPDERISPPYYWGASAKFISYNNAHCVGCDALGNVHVIWSELLLQDTNETGRICGRIWYREFNGGMWIAPRLIRDPCYGGGYTYTDYPAIVVEPGGNLHVIWKEDPGRIFYEKFDGTSWSEALAVTASGHDCYLPSFAQGADGSLHLVWCESVSGNDEIFYEKSPDGVSWGPALQLTNAPGISSSPAVACGPGGEVHVAWYDKRDGAAEIYYKKFDGASWGPDTRLTNAGMNAASPGICVDAAGKVYIAWSDYRDGNNEIYIKIRDGTSWGPDVRLTRSNGTSWNPSLAVDGEGRIIVAWFDGRNGESEIYFKIYDGGVWGPDERLTESPGASENPSVAFGPLGDRHVVWQDFRDGNFEIYHKIWRGTGAAAPNLISVSPQVGYVGEAPILTLTGEHFAGPGSRAVVRLARPGEADISTSNIKVPNESTLTCDLDLGGVATGQYDVMLINPDGQADTLVSAFAIQPGWSEVTRLTNAPGQSLLSRPGARCLVAGENGQLHSVWYDNRTGTDQIYYKHFDGAAWGPDQCISPGLGASSYPSLTLDGMGRVDVVWQTAVDGSNNEIYFVCFDGHVWQTPVRLTDRPYSSDNPSIGASQGDTLHVVWSDHATGKQICYMCCADGYWSAPLELTSRTSTAELPSITIDSAGEGHVVWGGGDGEVYYRTFSGSSWGPSERLTYDSGAASQYASVRTDSANNIHVFWGDYGLGQFSVCYMVNTGGIWGGSQRITGGSNQSFAVDGSGRIQLVWNDDRAGGREIYYKVFDGSTWGPDRRVTLSPTAPNSPFVVVDDDGRIHLLWSDSRAGNWEIYYKCWDTDVGYSGVAGDATPILLGGASGVYPNPSRNRASIRLNLPRPALVAVSVYTVDGRRVWSTDLGSLPAGEHRVSWDGLDGSGTRVAAGVYILKIEAGPEAIQRKIVMLR